MRVAKGKSLGGGYYKYVENSSRSIPRILKVCEEKIHEFIHKECFSILYKYQSTQVTGGFTHEMIADVAEMAMDREFSEVPQESKAKA